MAKNYVKPTSKQVELAIEKAARASRRAAKLAGQFNGTVAIEPSQKQKAAWAAAANRLPAVRAAKNK